MKIKKYQLITCLLAIYAAFMTFYFGLDLLKEGKALRFWLTFSGELVVIILAFFALRKRDQYSEQRRQREMEK